jgi:NAD+ synthetase
MRVRLAQLNPTVGDLGGNLAQIRSTYAAAAADGIDLLVLPELVVCGYPPMDLLERRSFTEAVFQANMDLVAGSGETGLLYGTITPTPDGSSRRIRNSAILACEGKIVGVAHKTLLPTYDIFDEHRYFEPNTDFEPMLFRGYRLGVTICEDIWNDENEIVYHQYHLNPAAELVGRGVDVLVNVSASPYSFRKADLRLQMLRNHARRLGKPILYANQTGANTEVVFDGDSLVLDAEGGVVASAGFFDAGHCDVMLHERSKPTRLGGPPARTTDPMERLFRALTMGIRDYVHKSRFPNQVLVALSGGIDSALVAVLAAEALGPDAVTCVTMPSEFSSAGSVEDSERLARTLRVRLERLPIHDLVAATAHALDPLFAGTPFGVAEENIQSRLRGLLIMAMSNKFGHLVLNTGNKSEMAVGYCTLYGDMAGGLSVISDVYKTDVYALCRWLNATYYREEVIPERILSKEPSAELRPGQKDADSLPPYDLLDRVLRLYIEDQAPLTDILKVVPDPDTVKRVVGMVDRNEYKRRQAAPGLRISPKAFGFGRRLPIVQGWREEAAS